VPKSSTSPFRYCATTELTPHFFWILHHIPSNMSLVRAFTTKAKDHASPFTGRSPSQRGAKPIKRAQISSPVALISTTNPISYDAPDIAGTKPIQTRILDTSTSNSAGDDSDAPSLSFDGSNTDASSIGDSPITPAEPEPNHLSCYFKPANESKQSMEAPVIPTRVPSHSKKAHERIHRKRSVQRLMSPPASMVRRNSADFFSAHSMQMAEETPQENPFGNELAQLDAVQEEISHTVRVAAEDEDRSSMDAAGLAYFHVGDYMTEIMNLVDDFLSDEPVWI
jgi:hypothetical protein